MIHASHPVALFDFDGTLSLIRTGWQRIMIPMMVDLLAKSDPAEPQDHIRSEVEETVWRLTGRETIYQMEALVALIRERGGAPLTALAYKSEYLRRLRAAIASNVKGLETGGIQPDELLVPGAREFLDELYARGVAMYLASGTDHEDVCAEARLLGIDRYFGDRIFGARDDRSFSKAQLVRWILGTTGCEPAQLFGFGDGYVEIEEVKRAGGTAVGVATHEPECRDIDEWKRNRLLAVGADRIVANYLRPAPLLSMFDTLES